tara:strand:- start:28692 stop:29549 length:858 start_codon:yes stop_codon:yes gene_type:complete
MLSHKSKGTKVPTLSQATHTYYKRRLNGLTSADNYLKTMKIIIKILGDKPVDKIGVTDVNKLIDHLVQKKKKNSTINSYKGRLETTLREMVQAGHIDPLTATKNLREGDKDIHILNADMEDKLIYKFKELDFLLHKQISLIGLETGLRWCEMFEVRKRNIDLNYGQITIESRKNYTQLTIPLTEKAASLIYDHLGFCDDNDRVFPFDNKWKYGGWNIARRDLGYEKTGWYVPHITRHTACTRMLQKGVPLPVVSNWLGHKSIAVTMRYAHFVPSIMNQYKELLNK